MIMLAQTETLVKELVGELAKEAGKTEAGSIVYLFLLAILGLGIGFFFVLRYIIQHTKEVHSAANQNIKEVADIHRASSEKMANAFTTGTDLIMKDSIAQREQHHKDMIMARDMTHAARDAAQASVSQRELNEQLTKSRAQSQQRQT